MGDLDAYNHEIFDDLDKTFDDLYIKSGNTSLTLLNDYFSMKNEVAFF